MAAEENNSSGFKVVDRRPFSADGSRKPEAPADERPPDSAPQRSMRRDAPSEARDLYEESSGFEMLVSYLSTTAMFQLGLIPGPSGEHIPADMPNAKRTIDLLNVLQEKTKGNLTGSESRLLEDVLYELRMSFLEMQKRQARKTPK